MASIRISHEILPQALPALFAAGATSITGAADYAQAGFMNLNIVVPGYDESTHLNLVVHRRQTEDGAAMFTYRFAPWHRSPETPALDAKLGALA